MAGLWCMDHLSGLALTCCVTLASHFPSLGLRFLTSTLRVGLSPFRGFRDKARLQAVGLITGHLAAVQAQAP